MSKDLFPVRIAFGGKTSVYDADFQTANREAWKAVLLQAHRKSDVRCCCPGKGDKRLSIHSRSVSDTFHLARYPETGQEHHPDCIYYAADPLSSGLSGYRLGVVTEMESGGVRIRLKVGLQRRAANDDPAEGELGPAPARNGASSGRPAMSLLGLLHLIWTQAGINRWSPGMGGKRNLGLVHYHLRQAAGQILAGRVRLTQSLLIATMQKGSKQESRNLDITKDSVKRRRLVVIAPLARFDPKYENIRDRLPIMGFHGFPMLRLDQHLWANTAKSFGAELSAWRSGEKVICIAQTDAPKAVHDHIDADVLSIALMRVTADWIPVESSHEAKLAQHLIDMGRRFEKPLRFDATKDQVFPDFWLQDIGAEQMPLEVFGMATPEYEARREVKEAYYNEKYGENGWWYWDATSSDIPTLPAPVQPSMTLTRE